MHTLVTGAYIPLHLELTPQSLTLIPIWNPTLLISTKSLCGSFHGPALSSQAQAVLIPASYTQTAFISSRLSSRSSGDMRAQSLGTMGSKLCVLTSPFSPTAAGVPGLPNRTWGR